MEQRAIEVLAWVQSEGIGTSAEVARAFGLSQSAAALILRRLSQRDLLSRRRETSRERPGGRYFSYWITQKGLARLAYESAR
jgi:predicted transcriptional regulator